MKTLTLSACGFLCLALLSGCGDSAKQAESERAEQAEKLVRLENQQKQQEKHLKRNRENHEKMGRHYEAELSALKVQMSSLKKENEVLRKTLVDSQAHQERLLDQLWTDTIDRDAFKKFKAGLEVPAVRVQAVGTPPLIDGKLDAAYKKLSTPMNFYPIQNTTPDRSVGSNMKAYLLMGKQAMYIAARIESGGSQNVNAVSQERDSALWEGECIDIFIDPGQEDAGYYHIITNAGGALYDSRLSDTSWNPKIQVKCATEKGDAWIMEMKIPLAELGVKPPALEKVWAFNINFFSPDDEPNKPDLDLAWSPTGSDSSHVPGRFGKLWMSFTGRPKIKQEKSEAQPEEKIQSPTTPPDAPQTPNPSSR